METKEIMKMFKIKVALYGLLYAVLSLILHGCQSVPKVVFETPVDTESKKIFYQEKKVYALESIDVYVDNDFDGARLNRVEQVNDTLVDLFFYPENAPINNSAYYAFKAWTSNPKEVYFRFNYPKDYAHRYIPKIKRDHDWTILDSSKMTNIENKVVFQLELNNQPITVAAQEIQNSRDVEDWYINLLNGKDEYIELGEFGKSTLGRKLPVIDIGFGNSQGKDVIVLLTRQHPPEVTGFYAFQAFLSTLLSKSHLSKKFLEKYHVIAFPIMNPDGVDLGHWRHNANGVDTNRDWSKYNQAEIRQAVKYIHGHLRKNDSKVVLGLDFHSTYEDVFYTNEIRESTTIPNFIDDWFEALEINIPDYKVYEASSNSTRPVSKGWFLYGHNAVGITYEIGDTTPKDRIDEIGKISATEMMKILTK